VSYLFALSFENSFFFDLLSLPLISLFPHFLSVLTLLHLPFLSLSLSSACLSPSLSLDLCHSSVHHFMCSTIFSLLSRLLPTSLTLFSLSLFLSPLSSFSSYLFTFHPFLYISICIVFPLSDLKIIFILYLFSLCPLFSSLSSVSPPFSFSLPLCLSISVPLLCFSIYLSPSLFSLTLLFFCLFSPLSPLSSLRQKSKCLKKQG
jgi:hypothetical protein